MPRYHRSLLALALLLVWTSAAAAASGSCTKYPAPSPKADSPTTAITIVNTGPGKIFIRWIDFQGAETSYVTLGPGEKYAQPSFRMHAWIARDERSRCLSIFVSEAAGETWLIGPFTAADRPYETLQVEGFTVHLSPEWAERNPDLKQRCLKILSSSLARLAGIVPQSAWQKLRQVPIWLEYEDVQFINGAYYPSRLWLATHGMDPDKAKSVQFTRNLASLIDLQPNLVLPQPAHR